jgi:putative CocE/NonD family hydrolase
VIVFPPKDGVRFIKNLIVPMSDGTQLALDMHVPEVDHWQEASQPLLLEYLPYRKDDSPPYTGYHHYFAQYGIIGARLDCRGTGGSEGVTRDEYSEREQQDGAETIEWLAQQPFCSGKVGMIGGSYGGFTSVQVAALQPPHLATIIPIYFTDDRYTDDCHYRGGAWRCYYDIGAYGASMIGMNAMPPYPEYSGASWAQIWEQHLEENTPYIIEWLGHQTDGPYWRPGSIRGRYQDIQCPVFMIGGWRDGYPNPPLRTFAHFKTPKRLLMGPWNHTRPDAAIPGPRIDYLHEVVRWCNYWLKGEENGVMDEPPVQVYVQSYDEPVATRTETSGYWRAEQTLEPEGFARRVYFLAEEGVLVPEAIVPASEYDEYEYKPTIGLAGGLWSGGVPFGLPTDQRVDEIDALTYTTAPLETEAEICGWPQVTLHVASTAPVMAFVARLCDVAPDGSSALVCSGVLNGTRRDSLETPEPMEAGAVYELKFKLDATAWRFCRGHRIRLSVSSADFPNLWPTPYRGTNRLYRDAVRPSCLDLPVLATRSTDNGVMPPDEIDFIPAGAVSPYALAPDERVWEVVSDVLGRRQGLRTQTSGTVRVSSQLAIESERLLEVWASEENPADVSAVGKHLRRIVRQDGVTRVDAVCSLRSTETVFHLTIQLEVRVNGMQHFQRHWTRSFARELL